MEYYTNVDGCGPVSNRPIHQLSEMLQKKTHTKTLPIHSSMLFNEINKEKQHILDTQLNLLLFL